MSNDDSLFEIFHQHFLESRLYFLLEILEAYLLEFIEIIKTNKKII